MSKKKQFILALDIETTGIDHTDDQVLILEVGFAICFSDRPEVWGETYLIPYKKITGEIYAINMAAQNGILDRMLLDEGEGHQVKSVAQWLHNRVRDVTGTNLIESVPFYERVPLLGKNLANFDLKHLEAKVPEWRKFYFDHRIHDPGPMYTMPGDVQVPGLKTCCKRAGISTEVAHTAYADVVKTIKLFHLKLGISGTKEVSREEMKAIFDR